LSSGSPADAFAERRIGLAATREDGVRGFGDLEAVVIDRLWSRTQPTTVREVVEELQREREIAYTTVMTVMDNLHRKGFLTRELDGRAYRYQASSTREEYSARLMAEALAASRNPDATLVRFLDELSPSEADALRAALRRRARRRA
jgi:predicted transcriptional regulator